MPRAPQPAGAVRRWFGRRLEKRAADLRLARVGVRPALFEAVAVAAPPAALLIGWLYSPVVGVAGLVAGVLLPRLLLSFPTAPPRSERKTGAAAAAPVGGQPGRWRHLPGRNPGSPGQHPRPQPRRRPHPRGATVPPRRAAGSRAAPGPSAHRRPQPRAGLGQPHHLRGPEDPGGASPRASSDISTTVRFNVQLAGEVSVPRPPASAPRSGCSPR